MIALRENEALATSVGIDVTRYLVLTTVVSAAMAGAAGALYAHYVRIVDPDIFLFVYTVTMVIMVVTGGKGTLAGPVVGGLIFASCRRAARARHPPGSAMDRLRRADGAGRVLPAAGHRAGFAGQIFQTMNSLLEVKNLSVRFGGLLAIEDLSFEVREGEVLSLIGPNGAGKTTAFNAITGYLPPSPGKSFSK